MHRTRRAQAYERRFPCTPLIPVFIGSEILSDQRSGDGAERTVQRRCKIAVDAPAWLRALIGCDALDFVQVNHLNLRDRVLLIKAHNESFAQRIAVSETCVYRTHPDNDDWTIFRQTLSIEMKSSFLGLEGHIEKFGIRSYMKNVGKAEEVMNVFIAQLQSEGITYVPRFVPAASAGPAGDAVADVDAAAAIGGARRAWRSRAAPRVRRARSRGRAQRTVQTTSWSTTTFVRILAPSRRPRRAPSSR